MRISSLSQFGGVNSPANFAHSIQRAAGFLEIQDHPSFVLVDDSTSYPRSRPADEERPPVQPRSLLSQQLESQGTPPPEVAIQEADEDDDITPRAEPTSQTPLLAGSSPKRSSNDVFTNAPHLTSPFASEVGGIYGSLSSHLNEPSRRHASRLYSEQQELHSAGPEKDGEAILVRRTAREDGTVVHRIVGQSTLPQTVLNSVNVLIGVGLLSLPLGLKYAGWLLGLIFLLLAAVTTRYTAGLLGKCMAEDETLLTFSDLAYVSFGSRARLATAVLFTFELVIACVALVVLFADSLNVLVPIWGINEWKVLCGIVTLPLTFVPFRFLGFSSFVGIICCVLIVALVTIDGLLKEHTPGSLREPATTYVFPQTWATIPLSFGLLMAPWGGHSVFPNLFRDMRHPRRYKQGLRMTFSFTCAKYLLDVSMAVVGYAMFGAGVHDEVTSNIFLTSGYPKALSLAMIVFIAVIPMTKLPLNIRPVISTIEKALGLDKHSLPQSEGLTGMAGYTRGFVLLGIRAGVVILITVIAILFPAFDRIMALMGSGMCFIICIILPCAFYLKLFGRRVGPGERVLDWTMIGICSILAVVGTVWTFLPKERIGA